VRGRPVGEQLEKVRTVCCCRNGLKLVHDETPDEAEIDRIHEIYLSESDSFVNRMTKRISELTELLKIDENPADAIELCMVAGLLADRMTNRQLLESKGFTRTRKGVAFGNYFLHSDVVVTPYHGKDQ
jgi:hypothetical protein